MAWDTFALDTSRLFTKRLFEAIWCVKAGGIAVVDSTPAAAPYLAGIAGTAKELPLGTLAITQASQYRIGAGFLVVIKDVSQWNHVLTIVSSATSPFKVSGPVEFMFNQSGPSWVVTIVNDLGVTKVPLTEEVIDSRMAQTVTVASKVGAIANVVPWRGPPPSPSASTQLSISVAAGDISVYQFTTASSSPPPFGATLTEP